MSRALSAALLLLAVTAGCETEDPSPPEAPAPTEPGEQDDAPPEEQADVEEEPEATDEPAEVDVEVETVLTGLEAPWDVIATDDERIFVTERDSGELLEVVDDSTELVATFDVDATGEGGLLGLAVGPDDGLLYVYLTGGTDNRVVRVDPDEPDPADDPQLILDGIPKAGNHNGGRIAFGPDGQLYIGTGDAGRAELAQDPTSLAGKILRVTPDGEVPDDNPDDTQVWALGLRNVQGLSWDADGRLWAGDLGPDVDDEINLIEPGGNYGWPEVTGAPGAAGYVDASFVAQPPQASWSGAEVLVDGAIPQWEGDLFVAALRGERLWRLALDGDEVVGDEELLIEEYGRLRTVRMAPDGSLWVLTTNRDGRGSPAEDDDRLLRFGP